LCFAFVAQSARTPVFAQSSERHPAAAQALYDDARQLVRAGKYERACPELKESFRLDPGGGTLLNLADCYEKQGKEALAWATFKEALVIAQRDRRGDRVQFARRHIVDLESRLARLTVIVSPEAQAPGLSVSVDETPLGEAAWGVAMPINPGRHLVRAEAPGKRPFVAIIDVAPASVDQKSLIPALVDVEQEDEPVAEGAQGSLERQASVRRTLGFGVLGLGVASLGIASYFGLRARSRWSDRDDGCAPVGCTDAARRAGEDARRAATISTVGFAAGVLLAGAGVYLVLAAPKNAARASDRRTDGVRAGIRVFRSEAGLALWGEF
jgi:hypothetical protein